MAAAEEAQFEFFRDNMWPHIVAPPNLVVRGLHEDARLRRRRRQLRQLRPRRLVVVAAEAAERSEEGRKKGKGGGGGRHRNHSHQPSTEDYE